MPSRVAALSRSVSRPSAFPSNRPALTAPAMTAKDAPRAWSGMLELAPARARMNALAVAGDWSADLEQAVHA